VREDWKDPLDDYRKSLIDEASFKRRDRNIGLGLLALIVVLIGATFIHYGGA
jgi:hypothetical protein